jgi:DNA polymerase III epsilon subunit-like protein
VQPQARWAVLDVETTGLEDDCEVIEFAVVHLDPDGEPEESVEQLVKALGKLGAQEVHGITAEELTDAPSFGEVLGDLVAWLEGRVVVGHNVNFDLTSCPRCARRAGRSWPPLRFLDTKMLAERAGYRVSTLQQLVAAVELDLPIVHRALPDALVTVRVFQRLMHEVDSSDLTST